MRIAKNIPAILVLEDGTCFKGYGLGVKGTTFGEICFNTSMTGYQEIFTDPSYYGQVVTMTTSHIGNYGVSNLDVESDKIMISGLICNELSDSYFSRPSSSKGIHEYFEQNKLVGIKEIDTRKLVRYIRSKGVMNVAISSEELDPDKLLARIPLEAPDMKGLELSSKVATKKAYVVGEERSEHRIALLDLGVKKNIIRCLNERGALVKVFPWNSTKEELLSFKPEGLMLSNGPGDPSAMSSTVELVKELVATRIPIFGICLGHQVLSLSQGLSTEKMHNGHRGVNHPIKNLKTGLCEITSQNHGFVVSSDSINNNDNIEVTHKHLNDDTVAGIMLKNKPAFSVQYHPESSAGPNDSRYLFDEFIDLIKQYKSL